MADGGAVRIEVPAAQASKIDDEDLFERMGDVPFASTQSANGDFWIWVEPEHLEAARGALERAGARGLLTFEEKTTDWVAESAALRRAVLVERYLLDPHEGALASRPAAGVRRLYLPAARAFGTGSHESTRLALRLLLSEDLRGARALDVGCGAGTLAFVAALEGARHVVAFDLDRDAAFATREQARANRIPRLAAFAGPLEALRRTARFDVVVANMIQEEVAPLLPVLCAHLAPGGRFLASGQLVERRGEWEDLLRTRGFRLVRALSENEWLGTAWISSNG